MPSLHHPRSNGVGFRGLLFVGIAVVAIGFACCADLNVFSHSTASFIRDATRDAEAPHAGDHHGSHESLCATACILAPTVVACGGPLAIFVAPPGHLPLMSRATRSVLYQASAVARAAPLFLLHQSLLI